MSLLLRSNERAHCIVIDVVSDPPDIRAYIKFQLNLISKSQRIRMLITIPNFLRFVMYPLISLFSLCEIY